ncbi:MAG: metallophosphoesterase [Verrucomicrobia bacterium]|nr:metallophosphoesterase [Verrucomicrobiota bacterium]
MFRLFAKGLGNRITCSGLALVFWFLAGLSVTPSSAEPATGKALLLADIHFDPLANPAVLSQLIREDVSQWPAILADSGSPNEPRFSPLGQDTNYGLFQSAVAAAGNEKPFDFVVLIGDYLRHKFKDAFVKAGGLPADFPAFATKTAVFVLNTIQNSTEVPVYVALGNNDTTCDDYGLDANGPFLRALADSAKIFVNAPKAAESFRVAGYYSIPHPAIDRDQIVVLNSVLWSRKAFICESTNTDLGDAEMNWLEAQLATAKASDHKLILAMHVPPGVDAFYTSQGGETKPPVEFWREDYLTRFVDLMHRYGDRIEIVLAAHIHRDDFRILSGSGPQGTVGIRIMPSVSPIYKNNPAFGILRSDPSSGEISGTETYFLDLTRDGEKAVWAPEYSFPNVYGYDRITPENLQAIAAKIRDNPTIRQLYVGYYSASAPAEIDSTNWPYFACAQTELTLSDYSKALRAMLGQTAQSPSP